MKDGVYTRNGAKRKADQITRSIEPDSEEEQTFKRNGAKKTKLTEISDETPSKRPTSAKKSKDKHVAEFEPSKTEAAEQTTGRRSTRIQEKAVANYARTELRNRAESARANIPEVRQNKKQNQSQDSKAAKKPDTPVKIPKTKIVKQQEQNPGPKKISIAKWRESTGEILEHKDRPFVFPDQSVDADFIIDISIAEDSEPEDQESPIKSGSKRKVQKAAALTEQEKRNAEILKTFDDAILKLQEYSLPNHIPCRETEQEIISKFIQEGIDSKGSASSLYISGVPGIGKTVSFLEVVRQFETKSSAFAFQFIHVNGLNLGNPENIYQVLVKEIVGISGVNNSTACLILNDLFKKGTLPKSYQAHKSSIKSAPRIVLLDELDYLVTKDQSLLYNLFDWPHCKHAKLIIVGIANTMDLPEKLLPKITSRIGNRRLVYKPYTSQQIEKILQSRLEKISIIAPEAITFVSKKIASFSSDIRRTLHLSREAFKLKREAIAEEMNKKSDFTFDDDEHKVSIPDIRTSYSAIYTSPYHTCIKKLYEHHKVLLISLALEQHAKGQEYAYFSEVVDRFNSLKVAQGKKAWKIQEITALLSYQSQIGLLQMHEKKWAKKQGSKVQEMNNVNQKQFYNITDQQIFLRISIDDITNALQEDPLFLKYKSIFE